jgi:hypothetical protein
MSVIKSMRMRWTGHAARMAERENTRRARWVNLKERPLGGVDNSKCVLSEMRSVVSIGFV